jgi:cation diffusion facilitator family transporter
MITTKRTIIIAVVIGILITITKFTAFYLTNSNAILTDALENIINIVAGIFAYFSILLAAKPRDANHPYGHGKVEFFSVGFEGALIIFAGASILYQSLESIINSRTIQYIEQGILLTGVAGLANFFLGRYMIRNGKKLKSITLEADGKHLLSDSYTSLGVIAGLLIVKWTGIFILDSILSIGLGIYILGSGYKLIRKSISGLMDEVDTELIEQIVKILQQNRQRDWIDVHHLRAQKYGAEIHIDCHVTLPYYYDLNQMHEIVKNIERMIEEKSQTRVEISVHVDPCIFECCHYCGMLACPVRAEAQTKTIEWNMENVMRNEKHFKIANSF